MRTRSGCVPVPDRPGPVDVLPLALAKLAVLKDKRVLAGGNILRIAGGEGMSATGRSPVRLDQDVYPPRATA